MMCNARPCCALLRYAMMCSWERAHRCATGPLTRASRAGVALRASVATRPPQRWNGLPEDAHGCATSHWSNASRAGVALRASVAMRHPQGWGGACLKVRTAARLGAPDGAVRTRAVGARQCAPRATLPRHQSAAARDVLAIHAPEGAAARDFLAPRGPPLEASSQINRPRAPPLETSSQSERRRPLQKN